MTNNEQDNEERLERICTCSVDVSYIVRLPDHLSTGRLVSCRIEPIRAERALNLKSSHSPNTGSSYSISLASQSRINKLFACLDLAGFGSACVCS